MALSNQNFEMYAGESKTLQVTVVNELGAAKDLTDASIKWALCKIGETIVLKQTPTQILISNPIGGIFTITLDAADTQDLGTGYYQHQAEITDNNGEIAIVFSGTVTINNSLFD